MAKNLSRRFRPQPPQRAYLRSDAKIRGYGGALGGGKSRTLCEDVFRMMLEHPGITCLLFRAAHTSIVETTKKTMLTQVIPAELQTTAAGFKSKASGGEDYIELWNGSRCHFVGMDNPVRWFSSEVGFIGFDEAQEMKRDDVIVLIGRLRQRCPDCTDKSLPNCQHYPHRATFTFNPGSPGHWLYHWFYDGGMPTQYGFRKDELFVSTDAKHSIGTAEFILALPTDNRYLPDGYIEETLSGYPEMLRRRFLEGKWEFIEGNSFYEPDDLAYYAVQAGNTKPLLAGRTAGDVAKDFLARQRKAQIAQEDRCKFSPGGGQWIVWAKPDPTKRYVMGVDISSGGSHDYSAVQIICIEDFEQVAEFQGKIAPTDLALEAYRAGRVYNNATAIPEVTGGWGFSVIQELQRLHYPSTYTRKVMDRLTKKWTDKLGWDTTANSRAHMLDTLWRVLNEREFKLNGVRTVNELATFVYGKNNKPEAQEGCNDDLVVALAIAVTVAVDRPRQVRRPKIERRDAVFSATGYGA